MLNIMLNVILTQTSAICGLLCVVRWSSLLVTSSHHALMLPVSMSSNLATPQHLLRQ